MALLGTLIDSRTLAAINANATASYAHGLPASPDVVWIYGNQTLASTVSAYMFNRLVDATNVTIQNGGEGTSPTLRAVATVFHSIVR